MRVSEKLDRLAEVCSLQSSCEDCVAPFCYRQWSCVADTMMSCRNGCFSCTGNFHNSEDNIHGAKGIYLMQ